MIVIKNKIFCLGLALIGGVLCEQQPQGRTNIQSELLESLGKINDLGRTKDGDNIGVFDYILQDFLPPLLDQRPFNENGSRIEFKEYNLRETSNDDAKRLTGHELIVRSGFKYEVFDAIADDGYITQVTHLINPLADPTKLRRPPVLMEHGGTIDPTAYLVASSIQHFPEKWPRTVEDGPMKSWNRSLAFVLVNNGFDVWLAETRGSNDRNRRHIGTKALQSALAGKNVHKNMTVAEQVHQVSHQWDYWGFSLDDIIAHELKSHMDTVMKLSNSKKVHLMTFSLSTPTSLSFLGMRPDYARRVQGYISMAPIISGEGVNKVVKFFFQTLCPLLPNSIGTLIWTDLILTQRTRDLLTFIVQNKQVRYGFGKAIVSYLMGSSAKWQTLLDLNVVGHLARSLSFKEMKQFCQQTRANKLQKFDYGPIKNQLIYNQTEPPIYDISDLKIRDWIVVSAQNDLLSTPQVYEHLYQLVNPKPIAHVVAPGFNHLDLIAAWENDKYVNIPILRYLERMCYTSSGGERDEYENDDAMSSGSARTFDLLKFLPPNLSPFGDQKNKKTGNETSVSSNHSSSTYEARQQQQHLPIDLGYLFESISKNVETLVAGLSAGSASLDLLNTAAKQFSNVAGGGSGGDKTPKTSSLMDPIAPLAKSMPLIGNALVNMNQLMQPDKLLKSFGGGAKSGEQMMMNPFGSLTNLLKQSNSKK